MKKILLFGGVLICVLTLAGCGITDNQTSTTSEKKNVAPTANESTQPEATKAPAKQGAKVEVVSKNEKKSQYGGASSIVGEVVNNGDVEASFVKITATYYDEKGEVVDTGFTYAGDTADVALKPTMKAPFELGRMENIKYANYKLDVSWQD
jgi:hypothetical protein